MCDKSKQNDDIISSRIYMLHNATEFIVPYLLLMKRQQRTNQIHTEICTSTFKISITYYIYSYITSSKKEQNSDELLA